MTDPDYDYQFFVENTWATTALLRHPVIARDHSNVSMIYDPCQGSGNVLSAAADMLYEVDGDDLHPDRCNVVPADFHDLTNMSLKKRLGRASLADVGIVSNPPFHKGRSLIEFIKVAQTLDVAFTAVFVELRFLASLKRSAGFQGALKPQVIGIVVPRPSCPPGEQFLRGEIKQTGGSKDYAWMIYSPVLALTTDKTEWVWMPRD